VILHTSAISVSLCKCREEERVSDEEDRTSSESRPSGASGRETGSDVGSADSRYSPALIVVIMQPSGGKP
jgi:hypothetical protein